MKATHAADSKACTASILRTACRHQAKQELYESVNHICGQYQHEIKSPMAVEEGRKLCLYRGALVAR